MKLRMALLTSVIGIFTLSVAASIYVGIRLAGRFTLPLLLSSGASPYYRHWSGGDRYLARGNYAAAIHEYDKMVASRPRSVDGYTYRAIAEYRAGLYDRSIQDNTTGLQLLSQREGSVDWDAGRGAFSQDPRESATDYRARLYHNRGCVYSRTGDFEQAVHDFKQAIAFSPYRIEYYNALSSVYQNERRYGWDAQLWRNAAVGLPDSALCWANYGWAQYQLGNISEAMVGDLRAIHLDAKLASARYNLALCYAVRDDWSQAASAYQSAIALGGPQEQTRALEGVREALRAHPNSRTLRKSQALLNGY